MRRLPFIMMLAALLALPAALLQPAQSAMPASYSVTALPAISGAVASGGTTSNATSINASGQVTGWSYYNAGSGTVPHAFLWNPSVPNGLGGITTDLGTYSGQTGTDASGYAINYYGQIVGNTLPYSGFISRAAFLWQPSAANASSGSYGLIQPGQYSYGTSINSYGQFVGYSNSGNGNVAFMWKPSTPNGTSGTVTANFGGVGSSANRINSFGQIAGSGYGSGGGVLHAMLWSPSISHGTSFTATDIGAQTGVSGQPSFARGINDFGQVVGYYFVGSGSYRQFTWDDLDGFQPLTVSTANGIANSINGDGVIVGTWNGQASIWDPVNGLRNLNTLLGATTGWNLVEALDINDSGQIVGYGSYQGGPYQSVLLTPVSGVTVKSVSITPGGVTGGTGATGKVTLTAPATAAISVTLNSDSAAVTVPSTVSFAAGQSSATFAITTTPVANDLAAAVTAMYGGTAEVGVLSVLAPVPTGLTLTPSSLTAGSSSTGSITLSGPAPAAGLAIVLSSDTAQAVVPQNATATAGATTASFTVNTTPVAVATTALISASYNGTSAGASLTIQPLVPTGVSFSPATVPGGGASTGTVTINGPAPAGGQAVTVSSSDLSVTLGTPAGSSTTVTIPQGSTSVTFPATTAAVAADTTVTVTATANSTSATGTLTVQAPIIAAFSISPTAVVGGNSVTATVTLSSPAPAAGLALALSSSNTTAVTAPATLLVNGGSTSGTATITTSPVAASSSAVLTVTLNGVNSTVGLTVKAPTPSETLDSTSAIGSTLVPATITLDGDAPAAGLTVSVSVTGSGAAPSVSSVLIQPGTRTGTFILITTAVSLNSSVTVRVFGGSGTGQASFTVLAPTPTTLSLLPSSVYGGNTSTGTVTLSGPAPTGGLVVSLASDGASATVPATVTVGANATTATFTIATSTVTNAGSANITASYDPDGSGGSLPPVVTPAAVLTIKRADLRGLAFQPTDVVKGGTSVDLIVTLTSPAPSAGATVDLTSTDKYSVPVPNRVIVPAGQTSLRVSLTTRKPKGGATVLVTVTGTYSVTGGSKSAGVTVTP